MAKDLKETSTDSAVIAVQDEKRGWAGCRVMQYGHPKYLAQAIYKLLQEFGDFSGGDFYAAGRVFVEEYIFSTPGGYHQFPASSFKTGLLMYGDETSPANVDWLYIVDGKRLKVFGRKTVTHPLKLKPEPVITDVGSGMHEWDFGYKVLSFELLEIVLFEAVEPKWDKRFGNYECEEKTFAPIEKQAKEVEVPRAAGLTPQDIQDAINSIAGGRPTPVIGEPVKGWNAKSPFGGTKYGSLDITSGVMSVDMWRAFYAEYPCKDGE